MVGRQRTGGGREAVDRGGREAVDRVVGRQWTEW